MSRFASVLVIACAYGCALGALRCFNGELKEGVCECKADFTGILCERKMNCAGYSRKPDGSCIECAKGFKGEKCERIDCGEYGQADLDEKACKCERPYSGTFCDEFLTKDIYLYYNQKVANAVGPLGVLILFPLVFMLLCCNKLAQRRQVKRVEKAIEDLHATDIDPELVETLLRKHP